MKNIRKEIIFISNPFGYGPTGKLLSVMYKAMNTWDCDFYVVGNDLCTEIVNKSEKFKIIKLDQRNVDELKKCLKNFKNPFIISSLNQFALMVANDLKIPNSFIDGLVWLWDKIPDLEYSLADHYFALKFPGTEKKIIGYKKIDLVSYITPPKEDSKKCETFKTLLHIGGAKNPYTGLQIIYLDLLAAMINNVNFDENVLLTGGKDAIEYLKIKINNKNVQLKSLAKEEFNWILQNAEHFITTPGLTACMESFNYKIPTSFLLPWNLSQWKILKIFQDNGISQSSITWEKLFNKNFENILNLDEQNAMPKINETIETAMKDNSLLSSLIKNLQYTLSNIPEINRQNKFIKYTGHNGAEEIINKLTKYWKIETKEI